MINTPLLISFAVIGYLAILVFACMRARQLVGVLQTAAFNNTEFRQQVRGEPFWKRSVPKGFYLILAGIQLFLAEVSLFGRAISEQLSIIIAIALLILGIAGVYLVVFHSGWSKSTQSHVSLGKHAQQVLYVAWGMQVSTFLLTPVIIFLALQLDSILNLFVFVPSLGLPAMSLAVTDWLMIANYLTRQFGAV